MDDTYHSSYQPTCVHPHSLVLDIHPCNFHHPQYSISELVHYIYLLCCEKNEQENRPPITYKLVKFENELVEAQDFRKITNRSRRIYEIYLNFINSKEKTPKDHKHVTQHYEVVCARSTGP